MKQRVSVLGLILLAACGGEPFTSSSALVAGDGAPAPVARAVDAGGELAEVFGPDAGEPIDASQWDTLEDAGDVRADSASRLADAAEAAPDVAGDVVFDAAPPPSLSCDPAYGDASPGGPCCVHAWATPTMGAVLCTVDGSRWCWQTGMPCSLPGSRCVTETGVTYCAP
jgi:hypothetical protein